MRRRAFVLLLGTLALASCASPEPEFYTPAPYGATPPPGFLPPPAPIPKPTAGEQVAILLPLTGPNPQLAHALLNAARLAMEAPGAPQLDVRDTGGTPAGAEKAAEEAIAAGDRVILGPLTSAETAGVASRAAAAGIPVLAFTSDPGQARPGVWTLGLTPRQQVGRLVDVAAAKGKTHFAGLLPENEFGSAMAAALGEAAQAAGAPPRIRQYADNPAAIEEEAQDLASAAERRSAAGGPPGPAPAAPEAATPDHPAEPPYPPLPPPPFDALLLAATGTRLAALASALSQAEVEPAQVQIMGPALWAQAAARAGGGKLLEGAWYAAPDPTARAPFETRYRARYGASPPSLADIAYDAAAIARVVHRRGGSVAVLTRPDGFAGVDGVFALLPDGHVRRALALFEIRNGAPKLLEPAPRSLRPSA